MRSPLVVVYDIGDDRRRALLRAGLSPIAERVQQSAWVVAPDAGYNAVRLAQNLAPILRAGDRLRVYGPCAGCWARARFSVEPGPYDGPPIVVGPD